MTIHNDDAYLNGIWDWGILAGCFGDTKIEPTDIDGNVNRHGRWLQLEAKGPDVPIPRGQQIDFEEKRRTGLFTIIVVWGERNQPQRAQVYHSRGVTEPFDCNLEQFRRLVSRWFAYANGVSS